MILKSCGTFYSLFINIGAFASYLLTTHVTEMNLIRHAVARQFFFCIPTAYMVVVLIKLTIKALNYIKTNLFNC